MTRIARCNRCGTERALVIHPLPSGWEEVCGADLCEKCSVKLHEFLRGETAINLNERVWVKRNGQLESWQLWNLMQKYGPGLTNGGTPPFDGNWIYFIEPAGRVILKGQDMTAASEPIECKNYANEAAKQVQP